MRLTTGVVSLAAVLLACAGEPAGPPDALTSLRVEGRLLDPGGVPVASGRVVAVPWYSSALKEQPEFRFPYHWALTGPDGGFVLSVPDLAGVALDSVVLHAYGPGCDAAESRTMIPADSLPDGPDGQLTLDLTGPARPAPTVTAVGTVCAAGDDPVWGARDVNLGIRTDSLRGELVYGRWMVTYGHTSVGPDGTFEGVQREGTLVIVLLPGDLSSGDCTELRLAIPIGAGGEWGRAGVLFDDGCMPDGMDLVFAPMPPGSFFPP